MLRGFYKVIVLPTIILTFLVMAIIGIGSVASEPAVSELTKVLDRFQPDASWKLVYENKVGYCFYTTDDCPEVSRKWVIPESWTKEDVSRSMTIGTHYLGICHYELAGCTVDGYNFRSTYLDQMYDPENRTYTTISGDGLVHEKTISLTVSK